jgi:hypothetical protein
LESQFSKFLKQQLQGTLTGFWDTVSLEFLKRWPEINVQYPDQSKHPNLTEEEKELLGEAVARRKQVSISHNLSCRDVCSRCDSKLRTGSITGLTKVVDRLLI